MELLSSSDEWVAPPATQINNPKKAAENHSCTCTVFIVVMLAACNVGGGATDVPLWGTHVNL